MSHCDWSCPANSACDQKEANWLNAVSLQSVSTFRVSLSLPPRAFVPPPASVHLTKSGEERARRRTDWAASGFHPPPPPRGHGGFAPLHAELCGELLLPHGGGRHVPAQLSPTLTQRWCRLRAAPRPTREVHWRHLNASVIEASNRDFEIPQEGAQPTDAKGKGKWRRRRRSRRTRKKTESSLNLGKWEQQGKHGLRRGQPEQAPDHHGCQVRDAGQACDKGM